MAYINFLNHCYIDTEVEVKDIYTSSHMWTLFESFLIDMALVFKLLICECCAYIWRLLYVWPMCYSGSIDICSVDTV